MTNLIIGQKGVVDLHGKIGGILISDEQTEGDWIPIVVDGPESISKAISALPVDTYKIHVLPMKSFFSSAKGDFFYLYYMQDFERHVLTPAVFVKNLHEIHKVSDVTVYLQKDFPLFFKVSQAFFSQFLGELEGISLSFDFI